MQTGKEKKPSGNIHRQQLFYWMGASLDKKNGKRKVFNDPLVKECLKQLRGSLENGLWVKSPRFPEQFDFRGRQFPLTAPICCFTEWSLGESLPHTSEYGRIGLGFPKRWVIEHGGQSVTYFRHSQKAIFLQTIFQLLDVLGEQGPDGKWKQKDGKSGFAGFRYLLHFAKMVRLKRSLRKRGKIVTARHALGRRKEVSVAAKEAKAFKRKFGLPLQFLEEREWRIVYHSGNKGFRKGPRSGAPDYYLPYLPGEELFTLVLPDNKVVCSVLQNDWLTERLFTPWKVYHELRGRRVPPVTLLSHSDIGTF
jgi:hypothetical protein